SKDEIAMRTGIVDAMNNAPQLGVVQTSTVLARCLIYGIKFDKFLDVVYAGGKWKKWLNTNTADNKMLCCMIAGHYHFSSPEYKEIIRELSKVEDIKEIIVNAIMSIIHHYVHE